MNRDRPVPDVYSAAVEKTRLEARRRGHAVREATLPDGAIKLTVTVGGAS